MPLYRSVTIAPGTQLLIWKITETLEELAEGVLLNDRCTVKMDKMKSEQHRKALLSVRRLIQEMGYTDFDLYYGPDGKPHLKDGTHISITHSYAFSAVIIGSSNTGIDIELQREKVITIADKFIEPEFSFLDPLHLEEYMRKLIVIWCVKEAVYKMISRKQLSFKQHINVHAFDMKDGTGKAGVHFAEIDDVYSFCFEEIEGFTLAYCLDNNGNG
ncbi:4-phosphopantetheinyl transferase [Flavobacterium album]|uniref:4-phosphopantetheinyl transferase n=1 Tax=Flavobacterium album TaxID=2175091 RepID=A0A2S1QWH7_9FLAO|nr:4'-phosphopantetheinyl transferase family protein [Flavobacterium album]AWH84770.1 4-phosphopantetheinyl transferase [Flavobacterium album]